MKIYPPASSAQLLRLSGTLSGLIAGRLANAGLSSDIADDWQREPGLEKEVDLLIGHLREGPIPLSSIKAVCADVFIDPRNSVKDWIKSRKSAVPDRDITPENIEKFLTVKKDASMPYRASLVAFRLGVPVKMSMVLRLRERLGLSPIGFEHECAFSDQRLDLMKELAVIVNPDVTVTWFLEGDRRTYHTCLYAKPDGSEAERGDEGRPGMYSADTWFLGLKEK